MRCALVIGFVVTAAVAPAQEVVPVRLGLMWNKTGLPAVFPLQVRTAPGLNYFLTLHDAETDAAALAAYIEGGRHFRVLVPPGTYRARFATGQKWQGEEALFGGGSKTQFLNISEPLTFAVTGFDTKSGHVLDLRKLTGREASAVITAPQFICQTYRVMPAQLFAGLPDDRGKGGVPLAQPDLTRAWAPQQGPEAAEPFAATVLDVLNPPKPLGVLLEPDRTKEPVGKRGLGNWPYAWFEVRTRPCPVVRP